MTFDLSVGLTKAQQLAVLGLIHLWGDVTTDFVKHENALVAFEGSYESEYQESAGGSEVYVSFKISNILIRSDTKIAKMSRAGILYLCESYYELLNQTETYDNHYKELRELLVEFVGEENIDG